MLSRMELVAIGLQALTPISVIGTRRSVDRKLLSRKSGLKTSARIHRKYSAEFSMIWPDVHGWPSMHKLGGCLLEWQRAQFSAKTVLPCVSFCSSVVRWDCPLGASLRRSGRAVLRKNNAMSGVCCVVACQ